MNNWAETVSATNLNIYILTVKEILTILRERNDNKTINL